MKRTASSRRSAGQSDRGRRQLVAAVCYRRVAQGLEFLLIQTRGRRWSFPKGGVEPGLTQAQSAALEAFEEAGVHGRIEEMPFARYHIARPARKSSRKKMRSKMKEAHLNAQSDGRGEPVTAHLCEVSRLETPQEANRNPTWFPPEKAKRRLLEDRNSEFGDEMASLVDRAVARIRRLEAADGRDSQNDPLQKVRFEAFENMRLPGGGSEAAMVRYLMLKQRQLRSPVVEAKGPATLQ